MTIRLISQDPLCADALDIFDSLGYGGFLLDLQGRVLSLNILAVDCLGDRLVLGRGRLSAVDRTTDRRLQHLVRTTLNAESPVPSPVAIKRPAQLPLVIRALRLERHGHQLKGSAGLMLLVLDPELWPNPTHDLLAQAFGLTPTESDIAIGIVSGKSLAEVAAWRHIKIGTVRGHLKTVFSKTHTHGQADLTRVLTRLAFLNPQLKASTVQARSA
ncbi:helix-turn-helix transcriptional regulator [Bradyrhizobium sp.]|uniref:helix-turn-helix transcriptional regulator n=1 Tax=Bradyrhizobium sp. TaxID=376 RepID=UPI001DFF414D|nr:LuxR C-terminal-related transcriptional regulator [Bradyrhizobium sp.]MBV8696501.1 hypothetical protein [Bradyrhizobium sp.]MBV8890471.1 hypothetical protein [Acidobacteriota bacterium]MBV8920635.1 hypothetical protein [Bradyrhizobium sp.]